MPVDLRSVNALWASVLVETLHRLGCRHGVICPGSRSAPLAMAFAQHPDIEAIPVLDERSASFFALGLAKGGRRPVSLVCTSGTAGANFYPALIEAYESQVPLLILTADRPPELRQCSSGQAIDQTRLFGTYPNWQAELALPETALLAYLRQTLIHAWERCLWPVPGPVHLNLPFRDPLVPDGAAELPPLVADFFAKIQTPSFAAPLVELPWAEWAACSRGLILAGPADPPDPDRYCRAVEQISRGLGWPILAEGLSPLRQQAGANRVSTYDLLLRNPDLADELRPEQVLQLGPLPTSKVLRDWLVHCQASTWILDPSDRNRDPLHGPARHLRVAIEQIEPPKHVARSAYLDRWLTLETQARARIETELGRIPALFEGKLAWVLAQILPPDTPLFLASSMPVRDVEFFWPPSDRRIRPCFSRGANGIDGTLSTALGIAHSCGQAVLLTGDLALLHDTNGFLIRNHFRGHLTIVLVNNDGGGIFESLPIAKFDPPFQEFFATPQHIDFARLSATYGVAHCRIHAWQDLPALLASLPSCGIRLIEIATDRKADARLRQQIFAQISGSLA